MQQTKINVVDIAVDMYKKDSGEEELVASCVIFGLLGLVSTTSATTSHGGVPFLNMLILDVHEKSPAVLNIMNCV